MLNGQEGENNPVREILEEHPEIYKKARNVRNDENSVMRVFQKEGTSQHSKCYQVRAVLER